MESNTLQGTNISPKNGILKMIFLFARWDMLIPWRVYFVSSLICIQANIWQIFRCFFPGEQLRPGSAGARFGMGSNTEVPEMSQWSEKIRYWKYISWTYPVAVTVGGWKVYNVYWNPLAKMMYCMKRCMFCSSSLLMQMGHHIILTVHIL